MAIISAQLLNRGRISSHSKHTLMMSSQLSVILFVSALLSFIATINLVLLGKLY
jgi:hypothetical protein